VKSCWKGWKMNILEVTDGPNLIPEGEIAKMKELASSLWDSVQKNPPTYTMVIKMVGMVIGSLTDFVDRIQEPLKQVAVRLLTESKISLDDLVFLLALTISMGRLDPQSHEQMQVH